LPQIILDQVVLREATQETEDRLLVSAINRRNEIENFIYSTRSKFDNELAPFVTNEDKEILLQLMQVMEDWLYSGDEEVYNKAVLEEKGKDLNTLGTKINNRYHGWTRLSESFGKLEQCINLNINKLNTQHEKIKNGEKTNMTAADLEELNQTIQTYNTHLNEGRVLYGKTPKITDPPATWESVDKLSDEFVKKCASIFTKADLRVKEEERKKKEAEDLKKKRRS